MLIGKIMRETGLSKDTIRYYEKLGLLSVVGRRDNNYKEYSDNSLDVLKIVRIGKSLGFTLSEIQDFVGVVMSRDLTFGEVEAQIQDKLAEIERKMEDLRYMRENLRELVNTCRANSSLTDKLVKGHASEPAKLEARLG